jgi:hypothetical protein
MYVTALPLWLTGIVLVGLGIVLSIAGPVLVRRRVSLDRLRSNNEVAGFKFAVIGVLYAVLVAFAVIVVWEKFNDAETTVSREAGAATTVYRLSAGIDERTGAALRERMTAYLKIAIAEDWPAMERGTASPAVNRALDSVYATLLADYASDSRHAGVFADVLRQLDTITQARRDRLAMANGIVPGVVWFALFGGAIVTIGFTFFFGAENVRAQALMTGVLSFLILSLLLIIIAIDYPFSGAVKVEPHALAGVLTDFGAPPPGK